MEEVNETEKKDWSGFTMELRCAVQKIPKPGSVTI
jgi:hypothetical protein